MKGIKYIGPCGDFSGYGSAARNYVLSLDKKGVPLKVNPRNFDPNPPPIANKKEKEALDKLVDADVEYDVVIIHLTPDLWPQYIERDKLNVGFAAWETSLLHPKWAQAANSVDLVLVPCEWNVQAFKNSGIKVPIRKVPHGIDIGMFSGLENKAFSVKNVDKDTFKFYSIFQWMNRKNPEGLIRAYFNAFDDSDDVVLILKTYLMGTERDKIIIRDKVIEIKKDMSIGCYPKVVLIGDLLSETQIRGLHLYGDCCAGLPRGEGWGLPFFHAGLAGNSVIAPDSGGQSDFLSPEDSFLVKTLETYVSGMSTFNPWYLGNQTWYESSLTDASDLMRYVYDNQEEAKSKGELLKSKISKEYSWDVVAGIMLDMIKGS